MDSITIPANPGHVVIGISKAQDKVNVYAYVDGSERFCLDFPYEPTSGHVLFLVERVANAAAHAGAERISYSSSVDFWEEYV